MCFTLAVAEQHLFLSAACIVLLCSLLENINNNNYNQYFPKWKSARPLKLDGYGEPRNLAR